MGFFLKEEKEKKEDLLIEYNFLQQEIWERSYRTWVINAIFIIGSSLVAFAQTISSFPTPVISILLVVCTLIMSFTSDRISKVNYERMEEIGAQIKINGPNKMFKSKIAGQWWYSLRIKVAYLLSIGLIVIYFLIIIDNFLV
jgi:hypothetical protein